MVQRVYYWHISDESLKIFWPLVNLQRHNGPYFHFSGRFFNIVYFFIIDCFWDDYIDMVNDARWKFAKNEIFFFNFFVKYSYFYYKIFQRITYDAHYFVKKIKNKKDRTMYHLILTFRNNKIFVNLNDRLKRNYFFMSTGFFIKYFEKKKLFRKSKIIRTILIKYLRKIFLLTNLPRVILLIKKNPIFFLDFLNLFNQQIPYKFNEPLTNREVTDDEPTHRITKFLYFIFLNTEDFTKNKTKKRGRVKRKISRKIVSRNTLVD